MLLPFLAGRKGKRGLFSLSSFEGLDEVLFFLLGNVKDSSVLKAFLLRATTKALDAGCTHATH